MSDPNHIDVSVIVTAHGEGRLIHPTMKSLYRAVEHAEGMGIRCETILVLDRPDSSTSKYFRQHSYAGLRIFESDFGDPGLSRNLGVSAASGGYATFLDGDDLYGESWLAAAFLEGEKRDSRTVLHPEYTVCFENQYLIARHKGMFEKDFHLQNLIEYNYWTILLFTRREFLLEIPFARASAADGFGYEDWHWFCEAISCGAEVLTVPQTCVFVRRKRGGSRLNQHNTASVLMPPTRLFEPATFAAAVKTWEKKKALINKGGRKT